MWYFNDMFRYIFKCWICCARKFESLVGFSQSTLSLSQSESSVGSLMGWQKFGGLKLMYELFF